MALLNVSQLNMLIQREISFNPYLKQLEVEAEIAKLTRHASGHLYFTIKDAFSSIDCVMFKSQAQKIKQRFAEGDRVIVKGQISLYEKTARLQFYAQSIEPIGDGIFLKAFQELKDKLEREGLLDPARKLPIPRYPKKLAILTSETGAAKADFLKVFHQKNPLCQIVFVPIAVQGDNTVTTTMTALNQLDSDIDLVVITRGGGSYEDLRYFNDEGLARLVAQLPIPTIAAIGHEVDFTIIEFVASARAATPTAAADLATSDVRFEIDLAGQMLGRFGQRFGQQLRQLSQRLTDRYLAYFQFRMQKRSADLDRTISDYRQGYESLIRDQFSRQRRFLMRQLRVFEIAGRAQQHHLAQQTDKLHQLRTKKLVTAQQQLDQFGSFLNHTNPLQTFGRGYSYLTQSGHKIQSVADIQPDQPLVNQLKDGRVISIITEVQREL